MENLRKGSVSAEFREIRSILRSVAFGYIHILHPEPSDDIEFNSSPKLDSSQKYSCCHWDLNNISTHNYSKIFLLTAYITFKSAQNCVANFNYIVL